MPRRRSKRVEVEDEDDDNSASEEVTQVQTSSTSRNKRRRQRDAENLSGLSYNNNFFLAKHLFFFLQNSNFTLLFVIVFKIFIFIV